MSDNFGFFKVLLFFLAIESQLYAQQPVAVIHGRVSDHSGNPLELVNVRISDSDFGTVTDIRGNYEFAVPAKRGLEIVFSFLGYSEERRLVNLTAGERRHLDIVLAESVTMLPGMVVEDKHIRTTNLTRIDPRIAVSVPSISGGIESLIKTMPGVSSSNELSSQYSVRGGNFDENLVYVNDIQIYRPFLIRSGQQEGLSFINSDLVSSILFSAGGFDARYGDKMSSVLDIQYRRPTEIAASFTASMLGANTHFEGASKNGKLSWLSGFRYKSNQYILRAMETKGDYQPSFTDFQSWIGYRFNEQSELSFLGNFARNNYRVVPSDRETAFGTLNEAYRFRVYFDGQEVARFENFMGALSYSYQPSDRLNLRFTGSAFRSLENETFDLLGQYWIGRLDTDPGSTEYGEVIEAIGVGSYLNHARNSLDAFVQSIEHRGIYAGELTSWRWGLRFQHESIYDRLNEWEMIDSAGYSIPHPPDFPGVGNGNPPFELFNSLQTQINLTSTRITSFVQNTTEFGSLQHRFHLTTGVRLNYWDLNNQLLFSPRFSLAWDPNWQNDLVFRISGGYYFQPPFYRELRDIRGNLNTNIKAQESIHIVAGSDWNFFAWERPFKFVTEVYYKHLTNVIPYEIDNVRIRYHAHNNASGYAAGIDFKINGEFVSGIESWASLSVMQTREDIEGDYYYRYFDGDGNEINRRIETPVADSLIVFPGFIPRPTDQLVNFSLFFQDYLPRNPSYRMHLKLLFGSGLPFGPPRSPRHLHVNRIPPYRRVDIGFSKEIIGAETRLRKAHPLRSLNSLWISLEVFNLLQISNTVSYIWISDINNRKYAIPNYLTPRQINLKIQASF
ncbi:MAG TPA: TonB-dependent receptor [Bacteroidales bacterium]|nr:TonB-dependent receptor [Bacteroidales bacterium]